MKRGKKGQIDISFGMIFSIILIIFFVALAVYVIVVFLGANKCASTGLFKTDLQNEIDRAWSSDSSSFSGQFNLPSDIKEVCFVNLSQAQKGEFSQEYNNFENLGSLEVDMYFYPSKQACAGQESFDINHISIEKIISSNNPYCILNNNGKVTINIRKNFGEALISLS